MEYAYTEMPQLDKGIAVIGGLMLGAGLLLWWTTRSTPPPSRQRANALANNRVHV